MAEQKSYTPKGHKYKCPKNPKQKLMWRLCKVLTLIGLVIIIAGTISGVSSLCRLIARETSEKLEINEVYVTGFLIFLLFAFLSFVFYVSGFHDFIYTYFFEADLVVHTKSGKKKG